MKKEKVHDNAIKNITETGALKMGKITEEKRAEASEKNFQNDPNVIYIQPNLPKKLYTTSSLML